MDVSNGSVAAVFGGSVKQVRERRGWSQSELARRMNEIGWDKYSQVSVSRTEEGKRTVRLDEALDLARVLRCAVSDLLKPDRTVLELQGSISLVASDAGAVKDAADQFFMSRSILAKDLEKAEARYNSGDLDATEKAQLHYWIELARKRVKLHYTDYVDDSNGVDQETS